MDIYQPRLSHLLHSYTQPVFWGIHKSLQVGPSRTQEKLLCYLPLHRFAPKMCNTSPTVPSLSSFFSPLCFTNPIYPTISCVNEQLVCKIMKLAAKELSACLSVILQHLPLVSPWAPASLTMFVTAAKWPNGSSETYPPGV